MNNLKNIYCLSLLLASCTTTVQEQAPVSMEQVKPLPIATEPREIKVAPQRSDISRKESVKAQEKKTEAANQDATKPLMQRKHPVEGYEANPYKDEFQVD